MKKIFTLIAVAAMAMSANAQAFQDKVLLENGKTYGDGDVISSLGGFISVTLGVDNKWKALTLTSNGAEAGNAIFAQEVEVDDGEGPVLKKRCVTLVGQNNPTDGGVDDDGKYVKGVGYNPNNCNTPNNGTIYTIKPTAAGVMQVGVIVNADKDIYVVKKSDGAWLGQAAVKLFDQDGNEVAYQNEGNPDHPNSVADKLYGRLEFNVVGGEEYVVFCTGSKMSFFGVVLTNSGDVDGINEVNNNTVANGMIYNLAGQQVNKTFKGVVIQNGKKFIQK